MRVSPRRPRIGLWLLLAALGAGAPAQQDKALKLPRIPVFGVVRDTAGEPVAGATVREVRLAIEGVDNLTATRLGLGVRHEAETTTNDHGKFVLMVAAHGTFGIVATKGDMRSQVIAPAAPAGNHELQLRAVRTITGRFVDVENGKELPTPPHSVRSTGPIESAIPGAYPMRVLAMIEEVRTAADGTFMIKALAGADCQLTDASNNCKLEIPAQVTAPVVLRREVRTVHGKVADRETKAAIDHYRLHLAGTTAIPGANGEFRVRVPKRHRLRISAVGYHCTELANDVNAPPGPDGTLLLTKAPKVTLHFKDARGEPAKGLTVLSMDESVSKLGSSMLAQERVTDPAGRLVVSSATRYGTTFWVRHGPRFVRVLELKQRTDDADVVVQTRTHTVSGVVTDAKNLAAAHVPIYASPVETAFGSRWSVAHTPVAFTDHAGRFTIPSLANLPYKVASRSDTSVLTISDEFAPSTAGKLALKLRTAPMVQGRVLDAKGNPVAGIEVSARMLTMDTIPRDYADFGIWANTTKSDANGAFSVPLVAKDLNHFIGINPLQKLASRPVVVTGAETDIELVLK